MISEAPQILQLAEAYAVAHGGLDLKTVSARCFGDTKKLHAIAASGADLTLTRARTVLQWFSDNWPATAEWPADISRPVPSKEGAAA